MMPKTYIVNTNKSNDPKCEPDMLKNQKCAAYYDYWKFYIDCIEANDIVFLYSNERGIIARGIATGIPEVANWEGHEDEEHYMELNRFQIYKNPLQANIITKLVEHEIKYNQTIISLTHKNGIDIWQHSTKNCL